MRVINLGSMNIDRTYRVAHFVSAGETLSADSYEVFCGGKGLNQSIALARAGVEVFHAGIIGADGEPLLQILRQSGARTDFIETMVSDVCGHAIIQVSPNGQNCIIVYSGTNGKLDESYIDGVLANFTKEDILLLQNETSGVPYAMEKAKELGLKIAFNPSPITPTIRSYPLGLVDYLILNEIEGAELSGETEFDAMLQVLSIRYPETKIVLTIGREGALYKFGSEEAQHGIYDVPVVDTTGAGDTFCGYFLAGVAKDYTPEEALEYASRASSIAVSRRGAAGAIPTSEEVNTYKFAAIKTF